MRFIINDRQKLLGAPAVEKAESRARAAFARFGYNVRTVELAIQDINGPRGGVDKQCRIVVRLKRNKDVVVTTTDEALSKAIPAAVDRAARSVDRTLGRRAVRGNVKTSRLQYGA